MHLQFRGLLHHINCNFKKEEFSKIWTRLLVGRPEKELPLSNEFFRPFTSDNDILLLELAEPLRFSDKITAICAPDPNDDYTGSDAIVAGWGNINSGVCMLNVYSMNLLVTRRAIGLKLF